MDSPAREKGPMPALIMFCVMPTAFATLPPPRVADWDPIGAYWLKHGGGVMEIRLYCRDSDSVGEKEMKQRGAGFSIYPNSFSLHAVYRGGSGGWEHKQLY